MVYRSQKSWRGPQPHLSAPPAQPKKFCRICSSAKADILSCLAGELTNLVSIGPIGAGSIVIAGCASCWLLARQSTQPRPSAQGFQHHQEFHLGTRRSILGLQSRAHILMQLRLPSHRRTGDWTDNQQDFLRPDQAVGKQRWNSQHTLAAEQRHSFIQALALE